MEESENIRNQDKPFKEKRKLAAIMFTDIVGYTALMSKDERGARKLLQKQRDILKPLIKQFNGEWLKEMGDGTLSSFESAVEAVKCAIEIQRSLKDDPDLKLRIGIHIGDVVFEGGDVFGVGVNVASRIEPLAGPGEICISKNVYEKIKNFPDIKTVSLGLRELKNVEEPLEVYRVLTGGVLPAKVLQEGLAGRNAAIVSIAVLPFVDMSSEKDQEYFCDGMAEEIINALSHLEDLRVVARTSAFSFRGKQMDVREIGRTLNVATVLEGSVRKAGNRLRISAQLINVADGYHIWSDKFDRNMEDIFAIQDEISMSIVDKLKLKLLRKEKARLVKRLTDDSEAYNQYLKGRYFWNKRTETGFKKAIEYFKKAIEKDAGYAAAYAGIADCYNLLSVYGILPPKESLPKAKTTAIKAVELDPTLAEAREAVAHVTMLYDWNLSEAEREFKRAIEINPQYSTAHQRYAICLTASGRLDKTTKRIERAQDLDPLSLIINTDVALMHLLAHQYDKAIVQCQKTLEMDPSFSVAHFVLGLAYEQTRNFSAAIREFQEAITQSGGSTLLMSSLGHAFAASHKKSEAHKILVELQELSKHRYVSPYGIATIYSGLSDKDKAFEWLQKACEDRSVWFIHLHLTVDPRFDNLRTDPRYRTLLKKMGL